MGIHARGRRHSPRRLTSVSSVEPRLRESSRDRLFLVSILWVGVFVAEYFLFLRPLTHHPGLAAYWANDYMPYEFFAAIKWLGLGLYELYHGYATMWLPMVDAAIVATLLGIVSFWRRDRAMLATAPAPAALHACRGSASRLSVWQPARAVSGAA